MHTFKINFKQQIRQIFVNKEKKKKEKIVKCTSITGDRKTKCKIKKQYFVPLSLIEIN